MTPQMDRSCCQKYHEEQPQTVLLMEEKEKAAAAAADGNGEETTTPAPTPARPPMAGLRPGGTIRSPTAGGTPKSNGEKKRFVYSKEELMRYENFRSYAYFYI